MTTIRFLWPLALALLAAASSAQAPAAAAPVKSQVIEVALQNGRAPAAQNTLRVRQHDAVELRWRSDKAIELHLHGYDILASAAPDSPATMRFGARLPGRFPVSEHSKGAHHHRVIVYLEVHP